jgi:peptidylprolyl isomerase
VIRLLAAVAVAFAALLPLGASAQSLDPENTLLVETTKGAFVIRLRPDLAPNHVARAKELARESFYDGTPFHRVIDGFMAQGGDPTGTGRGGSSKPDLAAEFTNTNYGRGTIGAARTDDPNSANSQFFICFQDCSFLNGDYTVWGEVVDGMNVVDALAKGEPPANPDTIVTVRVAADVQ